jgi:membrane protein YqaA with SNARE-associated domain
MLEAHADLLRMLSPLGLYGATFVVCFISGFVPLVNTEAYLLAVSALTPLSTAFPLTLAAATGQMTAKVMLYGAGRGAVRLPIERYRAKLDKVRTALDRHQGRTGAFLFFSAFSGLPPFYLTSVAAGTMRLPLGVFYACGLAGRFLRFAVPVILPKIVVGLMA